MACTIRESSPFSAAQGELEAVLREAGLFVAREFSAPSDRPIIPRVPQDQFDRLVSSALPEEGQSLDSVRQRAEAFLARYTARLLPAGFSAMVTASPNPYALLAEILACAVNQHVMRGDVCELACRLEQRVIGWLGKFMEYPAASGTLTSGGATANLLAIAAARTSALGSGVRRRGLDGVPLVAYASSQTHVSTMRAMDILGIGADNLRTLPVDNRYRLDLAALEDAVRSDRDAGRRPFAVVAQGGSVAVGAVDPLDAIAGLCERERLWLHVDAAYGGPAAGVEPAKQLFRGLARADSVTVDPHKWLSVNYECGCLLVKRAEGLEAAFAPDEASYLKSDTATDAPDFMNRGIEFSRGFRALKLWATFVGLGARKLRMAISQDIHLAEHFAGLLARDDHWALCAPPSLSIITFRFVPDSGLSSDYLDALNERIPAALRADGRMYLGSARIDGRIALRSCLINHRVTDADVAGWVRIIKERGMCLHRDNRAWWTKPVRQSPS